MKLSRIMLAVASLAAASVAMAAPNDSRIGYSTGASATKGNLRLALIALCPAGNTLTEFTSGGNVSTYVCATSALSAGATGTYATSGNAVFTNFTGTQFAELRLNVGAGSFSFIRGFNNVFTDDFGSNLVFREPALGASGADQSKAQLLAARPTVVYVGGLSDVQASAFTTGVTAGFTLPNTPSVGVQQAFGVAVSVPLYNEMFKSQRATSGGATQLKPIPSAATYPSCTTDGSGNPTNTTDPVCMPTISKGEMASIMSASDTNAAYTKGANFLASTLPAGTELRYVRRVNTSGTQAAAQNYFLGLPCSAVSNTVVDEPTAQDENDTVVVPGFIPATFDLFDSLIGSIRVLAAGGTTNVRQELSKSTIQSGATNHAIGVMSGENNQTVGNLFRWLRVQGASMTENAAPGLGQTNRVSVVNGSYDFYYESVYAAGPANGVGVNSGASVSGAAANFWIPVSNALKTLNATGLVKAADQLYTKGGQSCAANTSN